jgi:glycosyltransferase involved in cell wall biosynthesis
MPHAVSDAAPGREQATPRAAPLPPLVVFSHLRWGTLVRRPQHLLTRLAREFRVFFIEEPVRHDGPPGLARSMPAPGVEVLTPRTQAGADGFHDDQRPVLGALLADFVAERHLDEPFVWLTTPMALPLAADLEPRAVIYDCADDFAHRGGASRELLQREEALLKAADVVLTASPSLHAALKAAHPNLHCLPNGVDAAHFARPQPHRLECAAARALHEGLARPRLGCFASIDERLDLGLVAALADLRPGWSIVMVGPVAEALAGALPLRPNIRWLGAQSHDMLPHLLAHWDACLLPLACGAATRHASPAQTIEYLAGGKPVVSTPIADVATLYGPLVHFADDAAGFALAVEAALAEPPALRERRLAQSLELVEASSWDATAARIAVLMREFVRPAPPRRAAPVGLGVVADLGRAGAPMMDGIAG